MNIDKVNQLYNFLADNGVDNIGTDMSFMARMQNPKDRKTLYDFLDDNKVEGIGTTFTEFEQILGVDEAPSAKMPSFEDFKEATVAQSRQSVEGRLAEARESLSRTTATDFATEKLFKPHTDIVQEERDYVLRPSEKVMENIDTKKVENIGTEEYKYLKGQRDISIHNMDNLIAEAKKLQRQMFEKGGGSVKGVNSITGAQITLPSKEAVKIGNLITILEDTRDKYDKMVTKADKEHGKKGGFVAGLGEIDLLNVLTAGWADVFKNIDPAVAIHKASYGGKLTPEEQLYLKMFEEQARLDGIIEAEGGTTRGYNIGSGLAESLPFITSMLTTGGIASAVKGVTRKGLGAIGREAAKEGAEKSFKKFAGRALSRGIDNLVGSAAAAAVTTPLQAGMYNNYIDNAVNEYMTYGKLTDSPIQRLWKSGADAFTDNFTEHLGGVFTGAAKYTLKNYGANAALGRLFGTFGRRIQPFYKDILKRTAYNGFVGEFEEEMWANFLSPFMRGDSKEERQEVRREAFSKENIITTLATTALMSAGFGAGKVVSAADATRKYEKFKKNARNALANIEDRRLEQKLVDIMALPTLQERCQAFANMNWQGDYKSMGHGVDYFYNSILKEVYDGVVKMEDANEVVMPTLRTLNTVVERGTSDVVTAQMDGKPVYIIRGVGDNAESAIVQDMEGNRQQVAMSSLQEVNVTPVSEVVADLINKEYNAISAEMDAQEQAEEDTNLRERGLVPPSDRVKADQFEPEEVVMVNGKTATINSIDKASGTARVDIEGEEVNQQVNIADMQKITPEQISSEVEAQQINQPALTQDGEIDIVAMGEEQTANYISEKADASYVEDMLADRHKKRERAQKGIRLPLNLAERQKAIEQRDAEIARLEQEIAMWEGVKNRLTQPQPTSEVAQETADVAEAQEVTQQEVTPEQVVEQTTEEVVSNVTSLDKQGNPIDKDGNLLVDVVESIDDITDEDFDNPTRSIQLPALPNNVDEAIGADGKPVIIKKNIFERNAVSHSDLTPEQSRQILKSALYSPKLYGQNQKRRKPYNWVVISVQDESAPNKLVLLEVNEGKDNVEIVHWHYIDQRGLEKLKRQAEREDGQLLILPSEVSEEVGALADPTLNQPSTDKNTTSVPENQTSEQKNVTEEEKITEQTPEKEVEDTAEDIHTREQVDALEWKAGVVMNEEARNHKATEALDKMAKYAGVRVAFVDEIVEGGIEGNGLYDPKTKTIYIASNRLQSFYFVAGHELLHHIKTLSPEAYKDYVEAVKSEMGENFKKRKARLRNQYRVAIISALRKQYLQSYISKMIESGEITPDMSEEEMIMKATQKMSSNKKLNDRIVKRAEQQIPSDEVMTEEVVADWTGSLIGYSDGFSRFVKRHEGSAMLRVFRNALEHLRTFFAGKNSFERTMQRRLKALDTLLDESMGKTAKPSKGERKALLSIQESANSLVGVHNISLAKLNKAVKMGGLANPSVAVFDIDKSTHEDYGEISLILPSTMVDSRLGRNAGTWAGDAWTPTYPQVVKRIDKDEDISRFYKDINKMPDRMRNKVALDWNSYLEDRSAPALAYWFLFEKGNAPEMLTIPSKYPEEIVEQVRNATNGTFSLYQLSPEERMAVVEDFIAQEYNGDRAAYEKALQDKIEKIESRGLSHKSALVRKSAEQNLASIKEYGFDYDQISDFVREIGRDFNHRGEEDIEGTIRNAQEYIKENGLQDEFDAWKVELDNRYNVGEYIFNGYTNSGDRKWLPHTIENASKWMKKQGREGSVATFPSFGVFVAVAIPRMTSLASIRKRKSQLGKTEQEFNEFKDKWEPIYYELGQKLQPDAKGYEDYGWWRLIEAVGQKNPQEFIKTQYGVELSEEDMQKFNEMVNAIRTDYPAKYFETKFERPVQLSEFTAAVVPNTTPQEVENTLREAGVAVYEYDKNTEGSRKKVMLEATDSEDIRFALREVNNRFNEQLQQQIDGNLPKGHIYQLGMPSDILYSAGIPDLPIELAASRLVDKSMQENHPFELSEVKDLPMAIHRPIAVFRSATHIGSNVILTALKHKGENFVVALMTNKQKGKIYINDIRSIHYRKSLSIINWILDDLADYIKPTFEQEWLVPTINELRSQPQYNSAEVRKKLNGATNIVQNFENPSIEPKFSIRTPDTFYSNAEFAVRNIKQEKATPEQWLKMIEKNGGLKAGEDKWLGLSDWLKESKAKTLTKQEVLNYINSNKIVVEDVEYGVQDYMSENEIYESDEYRALEESLLEYEDETPYIDKEKFKELRNKDEDFVDGFDVDYWGEQLLVKNPFAAARYLGISNVGKRINETRLAYTTNGLTNKREIALVVPTIEPWEKSDDVHFGDAGEGRAVAWVRFGETADADGKRVLVIDEIQSKRHQDGREKGYISDDVIEAQRQYDYLYNKMYKEGLTAEEHNRYYFLGEFIKDNFGIVPSAPFEKNWHEVAMKRILRYAAENGYDKVAWTTGDQQAERYNIGNVIESAKIMDGADGGSPSYRAVVLTPKNDTDNNYVLYVNEDGIIRNTEGAARNMGLRDKHLSDVVGKALAEKLLSSPNNTSISGDGLRIGGEGMRAFYDQILPNFMNKYGKKWGVKVGEVTMPDLAENNTMHSVAITPAMRESVMQGQPLFSLRNMVPTDEPVTYNNFYNSTAGIWEALPISEAPTREPDYESKRWDGFGISSRYWYGEDEGGEYVIRKSDHWSRTIKSDVSAEDFKRNPYGKYASIPIASCRWALDYRNVAIDEYADKKGVSYGKIYLQDLTHYEDTYVRHSLRLPEYQERFSQLTEEYNALDKNDAKALADFRARKRTLVEEYWNDFARALGADVDARAIDSTDNPEVLRPYYDMYIERVRDGRIEGEEITFEEFVEDYNKDEDMIAGHIYDSNIIFIDMAKTDKYTTTKAFTRFFIHEYAHTIIEREVSEQELIDIWNENANTEFGKSLEDGYKDETPNELGDEVLAYTVSGIGNADIRPLLNYIEGDKKVSEDDVLKVFGNALPLNAEKAKQLLKIIKNGYREKGAGAAQEGAQLLEKGESQLSTWGGGRRPNGGYSAGETYIENGRRVTVLDEDFSIVEDIPEFDESPKYSLKDPIEQLRKENGIVAKSFEKENELIAEKFGTEGVGRKIEKGMFNYLADVQMLQDNLYAAGVVRSDDNDFVNKMEGVRNMVERALPQELEKYVYPLLKVISTITKKFGFEYTAVSDYLAAKHSIEREDESKIQTMSTEANAVWNRERVEKIVSDFESKVPENVRELLWKGVKGIEQRTLEILKKVGVYTAADIEAIQSHNWKYYVPLQGWDTKEEELIEVNKIYDLPQSGTSSTNGRWQEHSANGRRTKPYDPLATIVAKLHKAVYVAETNKAMHALYNLVTDATRALGTEKVSFIFKASDAYYRKTQDGYEEIDADEVTPEELESNRKLHAELRKLYNERKQTDDAATIKKIDAQIKAAKSKLTIFVKAGDMAIPKEVNISQQTTRARRVYFYMNGKRMYIQFVNPKYSAAINGQTLWKRNELDKFVAGWTRWLSQTYTSLNPEFSFVTNPIRDFRDAVITHLLDAEHGNIVGFVQYMRPNSGARSAIFRAQRGTAQPLSDKELEEYNLRNRDDRKALIRKYGEKRVYDTLFKWYADNGGATGGGRVYSVQTVADDLKKKAEILKQGDISTHSNVYDALSDSAEITTRFATFLASLDKGESVRQAVVNGRNVSVNFNRKGAWSDKIGAYHSFFNASAQGIYKYLTLARKYPKRFVAVAMSQIALGYATCLLIDYLYDLLLPDDDGDEIQTIEIPLWERLGYTAIPFMRRNGKVHTIRIPKSITFASFSAIGVLLNELQKQRITGEEALLAAASQMMSSWTYGFSEGAPFWRAAVPTVLQPIADIMNNTDAFGREVYRTDRFKQGIPNSELGLRNVIPWMYSMTKALNKATGGNEFKSGVIDINPSVVQYIMEQYAGGFGVLARKAIEFGASLFTDKVEFEMQNLLLLGRLTYTVEPKSWYPDYKKVQDAFGTAVFSNARNQYQAGYITEDELRQIGMRNYIFKNNDKVIKNLIDLRGNYAPSSMEYKVINREINRQRGLVVKIFEEADFNNRNSISEIIKKYDPNRSNNLTNLYKEYAK